MLLSAHSLLRSATFSSLGMLSAGGASMFFMAQLRFNILLSPLSSFSKSSTSTVFSITLPTFVFRLA